MEVASDHRCQVFAEEHEYAKELERRNLPPAV